MKFVLEPMVFAFDQGLSKQELVQYLEELLELDSWWEKHREDMFVQDSTGEVLWNNNYYPVAGTLKPLMEKHRIDFLQFGVVNKIIDKMLNKSKVIDSLFDGLFGMKSQTLKRPISVQPTIKRPQALQDELLNLLWHVFLAHEFGGYEEKAFVVITKGISEVIGVEYKYEEMNEKYELKENTGISEVNCKCSLSDFLNDETTPFLLWKTAERKADLDLGIRVSLLQLKGASDIASMYADYSFMC